MNFYTKNRLLSMKENIGNIILFSEVWQELGHQIDEDDLMGTIEQDVPKVLEILKNPTQGKRINREFFRLRSRSG